MAFDFDIRIGFTWCSFDKLMSLAMLTFASRTKTSDKLCTLVSTLFSVTLPAPLEKKNITALCLKYLFNMNLYIWSIKRHHSILTMFSKVYIHTRFGGRLWPYSISDSASIWYINVCSMCHQPFAANCSFFYVCKNPVLLYDEKVNGNIQ